MSRRVLVTGAGGFVGRGLIPVLSSRWEPRLASRRPRAGAVDVGSIDGTTNWTEALSGCEAVVHLAARVHLGARAARSDHAAFYATNRDATIRLAREAARLGVQRLVYVSTVKVNGEGGPLAYDETHAPMPQGPYALSKYEAELGLSEVAHTSGLEIVILRPPLIYGPGVGGNFRALLSLVDKGVPLPLGAIQNARSFIGLQNFISIILLALDHPAAAGRTYLVSDQHDLSTPALVSELAHALDVNVRLLRVPKLLLGIAAAVAGRSQSLRQLTGSLTVNSSAITRELGWRPPTTVGDEIAETALWFRKKSGDAEI